MENRNIAIDGPAGSGKTTIVKILSEKLGLVNIDTGVFEFETPVWGYVFYTIFTSPNKNGR